ncbi:MAG: hypothetical protein ACOYBL_12630 [Lachnospiraceae bacterium]
MDQKDIFETVICEMTERALAMRRDTCEDAEQQLYQKASVLSKQKQEVLLKLTPEERQAVEDYIVTISLIAQHECEYLYVQGAKDCVPSKKKRSMKRL